MSLLIFNAGGPGVVHEVEEFIWNDHFVIPIMSTGGAAGGMYGVPVKIFDVIILVFILKIFNNLCLRL